jgi:catechol 2,3-dioxygenase-like lactoylglutathione lyase family enzyme
MQLGAFSVSLAVKDIAKSRAFYDALGFAVVHGEAEHGFLSMRNGEHNIGLFQGMFEKNILTFNPGWNQQGESVGQFTDVREIQKALEAKGIKVVESAKPGTEPTHFTLIDPDGNPVLIDQHVEAPGSGES